MGTARDLDRLVPLWISWHDLQDMRAGPRREALALAYVRATNGHPVGHVEDALARADADAHRLAAITRWQDPAPVLVARRQVLEREDRRHP